MASILKQSTAVDVLIGPFVDSTDGYTSETGLSPSVKLSKNGQALAAKNDATTPVHDADGYYNCELDATDTNTVGTLVLTVAGDATSLPVRHEFYVVEEAIYDALFGASAAGFDASGRVDVGSWLGNAVTASSGNPDVNVETIDDIDAPATWKTSVNAEVDTALTDIGLDHLLAASVAGTDVTDDSIVAKLVSASATADWDDFVNTTDALQALRDNLATAAALTTVDTVVDAIKVVTDALGATAAANLKLSAETMVAGTIDDAAFTPTTTEFEADDITEATADHYNGRIVIFTTGALTGQATDITDYSLSGSNGHFTVTAMTEAPANNDTFIVI